MKALNKAIEDAAVFSAFRDALTAAAVPPEPKRFWPVKTPSPPRRPGENRAAHRARINAAYRDEQAQVNAARREEKA